MKVGVLYICTGKYRIFWKDFYLSSEKFFLPDAEKCYFVFTDAEHIFDEENINVVRIYQQDLGWPDNSLMRFHFFFSQYDALKRFDYLFFFNANCLFVDRITCDEFLPRNNDLLLVNHPIYYDKPITEFTYDRNPKSTAFIPYGEGRHYVSGGVNGGKAQAFLQLCRELKTKVDKDKENGVVALWHDESHLNRYAYENENYLLLGPEFFYPEGWSGEFKPRILVREKTKYFNVDKLKHHKVDMKHRVKHLLRRLTGKMIRF